MGLLSFMSKFTKKEEESQEVHHVRVESVEEKPTFNKPKSEVHELPRIPADSVKGRLDRLYREEHANDPAPDTRLRSVKERLEELKVKPKPAVFTGSPLGALSTNHEQPAVMPKKEPSDENLVQARVDKAMKRIESIRQKMEKTDSYLGFFYDLKAAEKEFFDSLEEANAKAVELPQTMQNKVEIFKNKIKSQPQKA